MLQFGRNTPHTKDTILGSLGGRPVVSGNVSTALREYGVLTVSGVPGGCWAPAGPCNDRLSGGGAGGGGLLLAGDSWGMLSYLLGIYRGGPRGGRGALVLTGRGWGATLRGL